MFARALSFFTIETAKGKFALGSFAERGDDVGSALLFGLEKHRVDGDNIVMDAVRTQMERLPKALCEKFMREAYPKSPRVPEFLGGGVDSFYEITTSRRDELRLF